MFTAIVIGITLGFAIGGYWEFEAVHPNWAHALVVVYVIYGLWLMRKWDRQAKKSGRK